MNEIKIELTIRQRRKAKTKAVGYVMLEGIGTATDPLVRAFNKVRSLYQESKTYTLKDEYTKVFDDAHAVPCPLCNTVDMHNIKYCEFHTALYRTLVPGPVIWEPPTQEELERLAQRHNVQLERLEQPITGLGHKQKE